MFPSFGFLEVACLLSIFIMSLLLVLFEVGCLLCLVVAPVVVASVPMYVNIMNVLFVSFEVACCL